MIRHSMPTIAVCTNDPRHSLSLVNVRVHFSLFSSSSSSLLHQFQCALLNSHPANHVSQASFVWHGNRHKHTYMHTYNVCTGMKKNCGRRESYNQHSHCRSMEGGPCVFTVESNHHTTSLDIKCFDKCTTCISSFSILWHINSTRSKVFTYVVLHLTFSLRSL